MNWFKRTMVVGALAASMAFTGCKPEGNAAASRASGSVALTNDDSEILAVDTDNNVLLGFDPRTNAIVRTVNVGSSPSRVIVDANDTAFVSNRGSRSVSVIRKGDTAESLQIPVGVEPTGMALTPDGKTLLVVSGTALDKTETGLLTAIDTNTLSKKWEIEVGEEPRAVAVIAGNRALVSLFKQGEMVQVDLKDGSIVPLDADKSIYKAANATRVTTTSGTFTSPVGGGAFSSFRPRAVSDLIVTPDGDRVFAPVTWAREDNIARRPSVAGGYYAAGGPCNIGAVATAGIVTVDTAAAPTPQVDDLTSCFTTGTINNNKDYPVTTLASSDTTIPAMQGATVGALDPSGQWLVVVNRETRNMAWMPAWSRAGTGLDADSTGSSIRSVQDIGAHGVDGIALTKDGKTAYLYSQFDHRLIAFSGKGKDASSFITKDRELVVQDNSEFGRDPARVAGRKLFFDAANLQISSAQTNVACSSCHLEGREDGHVWQFPDGARQTPALGGRKLLSTGPFHWSGEFDTIAKFNAHTITERMGGKGLPTELANQLDYFIDTMPLSDNPLRGSEAARRGEQAFNKAGCDTCHTGALLTNNTNRDVGTTRLSGSNPDNGPVVQQGFNVPSLLGVGRTAPYLHDGSSLTLSARVFTSDTRHGNTTVLSDQEKGDLLVYLRSL